MSESRMIYNVDNYALKGNCYVKFGVASEWLGY